MKKVVQKSLYDGVGWTEEIKAFLRYNIIRALIISTGLYPRYRGWYKPNCYDSISTGTSSRDFSPKFGVAAYLVKWALCKMKTLQL